MRLKRANHVYLGFEGSVSLDCKMRKDSLEGKGHLLVAKLRSRFSRTQEAIRMACHVADLTVMYDNSRSPNKAFTLVRSQRRNEILYDCRNPSFQQDPELVSIASIRLAKVAPL